jgi:protoporphyrin/coproporphyrin ferrochelatase
METESNYDALLIVSFGGPEEEADVIPFLENVTRGRNIPKERLLDVAEHYHHFGGKSPINEQCRQLINALKVELSTHGPNLPIYWGNRNWDPFLNDTLQQMKTDGVKRALAFMTSAYSSYSGCRQYRENVRAAQEAVGKGAPQIDKLRVFYNHPGYVEVCAEQIREAWADWSLVERQSSILVFSAHSIPTSMAENCDYEKQLKETCRLVSDSLGKREYRLVYQSRSGAPGQPWLGPDILHYLTELSNEGVKDVLLAPVGFISDHMEVLYDLDTEAMERAHELGIRLVRAATAGTHPTFIRMIRELIEERMNPGTPKKAIGFFAANHDVCPGDCCLPPARPSAARPA